MGWLIIVALVVIIGLELLFGMLDAIEADERPENEGTRVIPLRTRRPTNGPKRVG